ncbi:hypothetical protein ABIC83_002956 [Roseateles asaccharophilus]|uniref:hypothetical protein n=1 Tax=Roseateles asaccharophilus TaxID=582607 RepID=UPI003833F452
MKIRATRYQILRGVSPTSRKPCIVQPTEKPVRVAYLLDEKAFVDSGGIMEHHKTVFLEDAVHDWHMEKGVFYYYGRAMDVDDSGDILVVFEQEKLQ